ncbi:hypothetical protein, partial [uncultured Methylobacterium sp.]|uniref:hypothetical protein n=1 Tax=uncultured Methylobacterium sp. TaxID=157278 RepID=UPI0035CB8E58
DRSDCRAASAAHFGLPALPAVMAVAFQGRLSLDDILRVAAFGRDEPRFADALARALAAYNLHIYATVRLQADWYLEDLERYALARGCRLVFFLIHRPERMPMLATMLEKRWLVGGVGLGGYDEILNTGHALFQAAAMNRLLHAPEDLAFWLETPWIARYVDAPTRRTVGRHVAAYRKRGRA